jgi:hypothetical protein
MIKIQIHILNLEKIHYSYNKKYIGPIMMDVIIGKGEIEIFSNELRKYKEFKIIIIILY